MTCAKKKSSTRSAAASSSRPCNAGSRPLVDLKTENKLEIVIQEIMRDKIYLDTSMEVKVTGEEPTGGPPELDLANL
jgi:hypothetical protein